MIRLFFGCAALAMMALSPISKIRAEVVDALQFRDVFWILHDFPVRLSRYDLEARVWLQDLTPAGNGKKADCFCVDDDGIYIAQAEEVRRYQPNGSGGTLILSTGHPVQALFTDGNLLLVNHSLGLYARFTSVNKTTNSPVTSSEFYLDSVHGSSHAPSINKIFGRNLDVSPPDVTFVSYAENGAFTGGGSSPYGGTYRPATKTWVSTDQSWLVDDSGTVYLTGNLAYAGSLGAPVDDLAFYNGDRPIALRGTVLTAYGSNLLPTGSKLLDHRPWRILVNRNNALTFTKDDGHPSGLEARALSLADILSPEADPYASPLGVAYTPDAAFLGSNGILYLLHKASHAVFRWDAEQQQYLGSIPLEGSPAHAACSESGNQAYFAYSSGAVRKLDLNSTQPVEQPLLTLGGSPLGMALAGDYLFTVESAGSSRVHRTHTIQGVLVDSEIWDSSSTHHQWNEATQSMYYFRESAIPQELVRELVNANGTAYPAEPPGGIASRAMSGIQTAGVLAPPIRFSPDGGRVVLGSGRFFHAGLFLLEPDSLANSFTDAFWHDAHLRSARTLDGATQYQRWSGAPFAQTAQKSYPGTAHRVFGLGGGQSLGVSILADGSPSFYRLDHSFDLLVPALLAKPSNLRFGMTTDQVSLTWADITGETSYVIERKPAKGGAWKMIGTNTISANSYLDATVKAGSQYAYRVRARNGPLSSPYSDEVIVSLQAPPTPAGFASQPLSPTALLLTWSGTEMETGYKIERSFSPSGPWTRIAAPGAGTTHHLDHTARVGVTHYYRIQASNSFGDSAHSQVIRASLPAQAPLSAVLRTDGRTHQSISLAWDDVEDEMFYILEKFHDGSWHVLASLAANTVSHTDDSLTASTSYTYRLRSVNYAGYSSYTTWQAATGPMPPQITLIPGQVHYIGNPVALPVWVNDPAAKISVAGLPSGVVYQAKTRMITGASRKAGATQVRVSARNSLGNTGFMAFDFVTDPLPAMMTGNFQGVVEGVSQLVPYGGRINLKTTGTSAVSGVLMLSGKSHSFKSSILIEPGDSQGLVTAAIQRARGEPAWTLRILLPSGLETAAGSLLDEHGGLLGEISLVRQYWDEDQPVSAAGRYHEALKPDVPGMPAEMPAGLGYAVVTLRKGGVISWTCELADGAKATGASILDAYGSTPFYQSLYKSLGSIHGWLIHQDEVAEGWLSWSKGERENSRDKTYRAGFPEFLLDVSGGLFIKPTSFVPLLPNVPAPPDNVVLFFQDIEDGQNFSQTATLGVNSSLRVSAGAHRVSCRLSAGTGLFSGGFEWSTPPSGNVRKAKFKGCIIPGQNAGLGFFLLPQSLTTSGMPANKAPQESGSVIFMSSSAGAPGD